MSVSSSCYHLVFEVITIGRNHLHRGRTQGSASGCYFRICETHGRIQRSLWRDLQNAWHLSPGKIILCLTVLIKAMLRWLCSSNLQRIRKHVRGPKKATNPGWLSMSHFSARPLISVAKLPNCLVMIHGRLDLVRATVNPQLMHLCFRADYITEVKMIKTGKGVQDVRSAL